jgi:predicted O-methyltransferase YrrM
LGRPELPTVLLDKIVKYKAEYDQIPLSGPEDELHVNNQWFTTVDMEMLYGMVRYLKPSRIIEIGSGHSTRCTLLAIAANAAEPKSSPTLFTAIDPEPRLAVDSLDGVAVLRQPVETVPLALFGGLDEGDFLFIDSSHIWASGNDVDVEYHQILPWLARGVIVHIHDIFLPDGYPGHWWDRGYTEQTYVAPLLVSGEWDVLWSAHYMHTTYPERLAEAFRSYDPLVGYPASLWLRKR